MVSARIRHRKGLHMSQHDQEKYKPGAGTYLLAICCAIFMMVLVPIVVLLMVGLFCAIGWGCFFADHNNATAVGSAILGFLIGFGMVLDHFEKQHKKEMEENRQRRLEEAQLRWLEQQEREEE